jgi:hypothetical protein
LSFPEQGVGFRIRRADFLVLHPGSSTFFGHCHSSGSLGAGIRQPSSIGIGFANGRIFGPLFLLQIRFRCEDSPQQFAIVFGSTVGVVLFAGCFGRLVTQIGDNLEGISLINQILLTFGRIKHFLCIRTDQGIEKGIKGQLVRSICSRIGFGPQDASQSLGFLSTTSKMRRDLNNDIGFGQINRCISDKSSFDGIVVCFECGLAGPR